MITCFCTQSYLPTVNKFIFKQLWMCKSVRSILLKNVDMLVVAAMQAVPL